MEPGIWLRFAASKSGMPLTFPALTPRVVPSRAPKVAVAVASVRSPVVAPVRARDCRRSRNRAFPLAGSTKPWRLMNGDTIPRTSAAAPPRRTRHAQHRRSGRRLSPDPARWRVAPRPCRSPHLRTHRRVPGAAIGAVWQLFHRRRHRPAHRDEPRDRRLRSRHRPRTTTTVWRGSATSRRVAHSMGSERSSRPWPRTGPSATAPIC